MKSFVPGKKNLVGLFSVVALAVLAISAFQLSSVNTVETLPIRKGAHISLIGNNLGSRMMNYGYFETEMQVRYPDNQLFIRNMCDPGDTPGFRPRSSRFSALGVSWGRKIPDRATLKTSNSEGTFRVPPTNGWPA